ncbi:peptidoglycan-binding protein [Brevundimonas sp. LM2]|uniref:peptidoglycan-binding protein n=1 Tax=Brevundimonas sp. LM2 TaxID=1938605 RepID=UPI00098396DE|nr:peptidoglycan-binding protein [Brevundimonas sp. LM2]AQR62025.1 peptidoglycan-binding protein [Brevundimonas sp. LM2]
MTPQAQIEEARRLLVEDVRRSNPMATLGAAALAATSAVLLAGVMILGPGVAIDDRPPAVSQPV